jgi:hypothetical protein
VKAEQRIADAPGEAASLLAEIAKQFDTVRTAPALCDAILQRHCEVQKAKPPEGKREWFEHGLNDSVFVRPRFRVDRQPLDVGCWRRPYRMGAVFSFCHDLREQPHG